MQSANWYTHVYLEKLPALHPQRLTVESLTPFLPVADTGLVAGTKGQALDLLTRLRATPMLTPSHASFHCAGKPESRTGCAAGLEVLPISFGEQNRFRYKTKSTSC